MSEVDEVSIISFSVSVPVDVIVQSGDVSDTVSVMVNESSVSDWVDSDSSSPSFTTSKETEDAILLILTVDLECVRVMSAVPSETCIPSRRKIQTGMDSSTDSATDITSDRDVQGMLVSSLQVDAEEEEESDEVGSEDASNIGRI